MFVAGGLIRANLLGELEPEIDDAWEYTAIYHTHYGWPTDGYIGTRKLWFGRETDTITHEGNFVYTGMFIDGFTNVALLIAIACLLELIVRRREARKP